MKKHGRLIFIFILVVVIGGVLLVYDAFNGNPISKMKAKKSAQLYIDEHYEDRDFIVEDVFYNFKDGDYFAKIQSLSSVDTHFSLFFSGREVRYDNYEDNVLTGWNTYERIDQEYREIVRNVFTATDFPLQSNIDYGEILLFERGSDFESNAGNYGIQLSELELDKIYDIKKLAAKHGHLVFYAENEEVTFEKMSELLLILKDTFDKADVPFYAIDFVLEKPRTTDGAPGPDAPILPTSHFLYSDIYEDGLVERLEKASSALMEYYEEQDKLMMDKN